MFKSVKRKLTNLHQWTFKEPLIKAKQYRFFIDFCRKSEYDAKNDEQTGQNDP